MNKRTVLIWSLFIILSLTFVVLTNTDHSAPRQETAVIGQCLQAHKAWNELPGGYDGRPEFGFPDQVMSVDDLKVGQAYVWCNVELGVTEAFVMTSEPFEYDFGDYTTLEIKVRSLTGSSDHFFLTDLGVVPYEDGRWNLSNSTLKVPSR